MRNFLDVFEIRNTTDYEGSDKFIRENISFKNENAWSLICSIFIASIGLNVNSTAVIIGAMLISPLMGPIIGAGYALAIEDLILFQKSIKSFLRFVLISLITSAIFFTLSPFTQAQSELLSRTQPTFYDLLIAVFGGIVGIVALTRSEKGNAIPGVAIATALMPPLCTVGFGISQLNLKFALGAAYLFTINVFFIALSAFVIVRVLQFKLKLHGKENEVRKVNWSVYLIILIITLPSLYSAWYLKQKKTFESRLEKFIQVELVDKNIFISRKIENFDLNKSKVQLFTVGKIVTSELKNELSNRLGYYDLKGTEVKIEDVTSLSKADSLKGSTELDRIKIELAEKSNEFEKIKKQQSDEQNIEKDLIIINSKVEAAIIREEDSKKVCYLLYRGSLTNNEKKIIISFLKSREVNDVFFRH